jgi:hypothetical protein
MSSHARSATRPHRPLTNPHSHKRTHPSPNPTIADADASAVIVPVTATSPSQGEGASPPSAAGAIISRRHLPQRPLAPRPRPGYIDGEGEDDGAARLAGVGVFSPVASMPGSPTLSRRRSFPGGGRVVECCLSEGWARAHRVGRKWGLWRRGEHERESSFTLLEREESFEDPAAAHIRRRVPGPSGADADD